MRALGGGSIQRRHTTTNNYANATNVTSGAGGAEDKQNQFIDPEVDLYGIKNKNMR